MMIPNEQGQVTQSNKSDINGSIVGSFNLDLTSNGGIIKTSPRMLKVSDTTSLASLTGPAVNFKTFNGGTGSNATWTIAGAAILHNSNTPDSVWVADNGTIGVTVSSDYGDLAVIGSNLHVAADTGLYKRLSGATTYSLLTALTLAPHVMTFYSGTARLYVTNGTSIISVDSTGTVATTGTYTNSITSSTEFQIMWVAAGSDRIWYGTMGYNGEKGQVYEWDGTSTGPTRTYFIDAQGTYCCLMVNNTPYIVDTNGKLLTQFNNASFREIDRFPFDQKSIYNTATNPSNHFIHPHGATLVDGRPNFLINNRIGDNAGSIPEKLAAGIWELNDNNTLYHNQSLSRTPIATSTITDYGQNRLSRVGALVNMKVENSAAGANGQILAGADYFTNATATSSGIWTDDTNDTVQKTGYLVTTKQMSGSLYDMFQKVYLTHKLYLNAADKIVVKYRVTDTDPTEMTITWVNTTSFTTTDVNMANYAVGDEVEVTAGTGSGLCSHISAPVNNAGTYTVTVDETYTGVTTGTAKARFQHWIKIASMSNASQFLEEATIGVPATWCQLKVMMLFTGKNEINKVLLINKPNLTF